MLQLRRAAQFDRSCNQALAGDERVLMLNGVIRHPWKFFWNGLLLPMLGWVFIVPLTWVIPRKRNRIIFYGRDRGRFADNVKYLFLYAHLKSDPGMDIFFLTEHPDVVQELRERGLPVLRYPNARSVWSLLRAGVVVTDSDGWISKFRYHLLFSAFKVQLWHGVGLKTIGLSNPRNQRMLKHALMRAYFVLKGKLVPYDLLVTTGDAFVDQGYPTGLVKKRTVPTGYPRNDVLFHGFQGYEHMGVDWTAAERIHSFRNRGGKVAAYLPTFLDTREDVISRHLLNIPDVNAFCRERHLLMVFKFHSWGMLKDEETLAALNDADHILVMDHASDIYPLLPQVDIMISDISSVYMDYLLLDRPILFFSPRVEEYQRDQRTLYFDYDELTPGFKCRTQEELLADLDRCLSGEDDYREERRALRLRTFNDPDGNASERIWKCIQERNVS